jgi:hypothetical protein
MSLSNKKKLIILNLFALVLCNILIYVYLNFTQYQSKILYRLTLDYGYLKHNNSNNFYKYLDDIKITKRNYDYDNDFLRYIYKSEEFKKLQYDFNISKIELAKENSKSRVPKSGLIQLQYIINSDINPYEYANQIAIVVDKLHSEYNTMLVKEIDTVIDSYQRYLQADSSISEKFFGQLINELFTFTFDQQIKYIKNWIKDEDNHKSQSINSFLTESKSKYLESSSYLESEDFRNSVKNFLENYPSEDNYLQNELTFSNEFFKFNPKLNDDLSKELIPYIKKNEWRQVIDNFIKRDFYTEILNISNIDHSILGFNKLALERSKFATNKNYEISSTRLSPSKLNLFISASILLIGIINLAYIAFFRTKDLFKNKN